MTDAISGATDAELVARVLQADREAFASVYDRYGNRLYDFAYSMLRHPEDAADAVADSFVRFAERLPQLRDPDRLRPWLYAIVRSECLRRLQGRKRFTAADDEQLAAMADDARTPEEEAEVAALRALVWDAAAGLADRDRALLDLHLRQGLDGAELADAMGVSASNVYVMLNRVKGQVDRSLGALLVARAGRAECDELDDLLVDWDGAFSPLIRKRVARHIENCATCGDRRRRMVSPFALLAGVPLFAAPLGLRDRVLGDTRLVAYSGPEVRAGAASGPTTLPRRARLPLLAAAVAALLVTGTVLFWPSAESEDDPLAVTAPTSSVGTSAGPTPTSGPTSSAPGTTAPPSPTAPVTTTTPPPPAPGALALSTTRLDLGRGTAARRFTVTNTGGSPVTFAVQPSARWMSASGGTSLDPGASATVSVRALRAGLAEGTTAGPLQVTWPDGSATVRVSVVQENLPSVSRPRVPAGASCDVPVSATVTDESRIVRVSLTWTGPSGAGTRAMTRVRANGWRTSTPVHVAVGGSFRFRVTATDARGNTTTGPALVVDLAPCPQ